VSRGTREKGEGRMGGGGRGSRKEGHGRGEEVIGSSGSE